MIKFTLSSDPLWRRRARPCADLMASRRKAGDGGPQMSPPRVLCPLICINMYFNKARLNPPLNYSNHQIRDIDVGGDKVDKTGLHPRWKCFRGAVEIRGHFFFFVADWVGEKKIDNIMYPRFKEIKKKIPRLRYTELGEIQSSVIFLCINSVLFTFLEFLKFGYPFRFQNCSEKKAYYSAIFDNSETINVADWNLI